jgi:putative transposase
VGAFVLMHNHVHFAASSPTPLALGSWIKNGHREYSKWYNTVRNRNGSNWEGRYFDVLMDPDHCWNALRYIEQNPVRAGLCQFPWQWKWSSAASHCGLGPKPEIVSTDFRPEGMTAKAWREALLNPTPAEFRARLVECAQQRIPLASTTWIAQVEAAWGIELVRRKSDRPRGRPPRSQAAPSEHELLVYE